MYSNFFFKISIAVFLTLFYVSNCVSTVYPDAPVHNDSEWYNQVECRYPWKARICGVKEEWEPGLILFEWYFNATYDTCRPLYGNMFNQWCHWLRPLATTKRECEDKCGTPCYVFFANKTIVEGVCMDGTYCVFHDDEIDHEATAHDRYMCNQWHPDVKCCPRDHKQYF